MSRMSEDLQDAEERSVAAKRLGVRDNDDEDRQEHKSSTLSRIRIENSTSLFSVERSDLSKEGETAVISRRDDCSTDEHGNSSTYNFPITQSRMTLPDRTEVAVSSEEVDQALQALESITGSAAVNEATPVGSCLRIENVPTTSRSNNSRVERAIEAISTVGPLPDNFGPCRVQDQIHFDNTQPPSYTSVEIRRPSVSFNPPVPPPSYGEVMGIESLRSPRPPPLILNVAPSVWTHRSQPAYCRNCHAVVISKIRHTPCTFTHMAAALLFLFMCWPFCFVPYCVNYCQQTRHHCPSCNHLLGTYSPTV